MLKTPQNSQPEAYKNLIRAIGCKNPEKAIPLILSSSLTLLNNVNGHGISLLQTAIFNFNPQIVKKLLQQNIDVNYRNPQGFTALTNALIDGNYEAVKLLLQAGTVFDKKHPKDKKASALALKKNADIAELLEAAERQELEPLSPLLLSEIGSSEEESDQATASAVSHEPALVSNIPKPQPTATSWLTLRRRDTQKVAPTTAIEMTPQNAAPTVAAPANHFHMD